MRKRTKVGAGVAVGLLAAVATLTGLPLLALGARQDSSRSCARAVKIADDGTPAILGPSALTVSDLTTWWASTGKGQPSSLALPIDDVIALYLSEADAERVRGDLAFAQAIVETGYFTNSDTAINNFAGIAHYDGSRSGSGFPDAETGIRAQIQLLKKFAAGNQVPLARPDASPNAGATVTTWGGLAGTWASSPSYWTAISRVYESMHNHGAARPVSHAPRPPSSGDNCDTGAPTVRGNYTLPVERRWYDRHPQWFTKPHHDYPAADIPVPIGTRVYAVTAGVVVSTPTYGRCGIGIVLNGNDRAQYTYCHGRPGSRR